MKVSEGVRKSYDIKKNDIFKSIINSAYEQTAQPDGISKQIAVNAERSSEKPKVRSRKAGVIAAAACAALVIGGGYAGGLFDNIGVGTDPETEDSQIREGTPGIGWSGQTYAMSADMPTYPDFSSLAESSDEIIEYEFLDSSIKLCGDDGVLTEASEKLDYDSIHENGYDIFTVYEVKVSFSHKGSLQVGEHIQFRQYGACTEDQKYDYGSEFIPHRAGFAALRKCGGDMYELTDLKNSAYEYDGDEKHFASLCGGDMAEQVMPWIKENFKGRSYDDVIYWFRDINGGSTDGYVRRDMYSDEYGPGCVISIEEDGGEPVIKVSIGSAAETKKYIGMSSGEASELISSEGRTPIIRYTSSGEDGVVVDASMGSDDTVTIIVGRSDPEPDEKILAENTGYLSEYLGLKDFAGGETDGDDGSVTKIKPFDYQCGEITSGFENLDIRLIGISSNDSEKEYKVYILIKTLDGSDLSSAGKRLDDDAISSPIIDADHFTGCFPGETKDLGSYAITSLVFPEKTDSFAEDIYCELVISSLDGHENGSSDIINMYEGEYRALYQFRFDQGKTE